MITLLSSATGWLYRSRWSWSCCLGVLLLVTTDVATAADGWRAGVAKIAITPAEPMWLSGYAARTHPAEGKLHELWAKCTVLEDPRGKQLALVSLDLVGIDRDLSLAIRRGVEQRYGLPLAQVAINTSHTHSGPVTGRTLGDMYFLSDEQAALVESYSRQLVDDVVQLVGTALENLQPAVIRSGRGTTDFAVNRRNNPEAEAPARRAAGTLVGPSDHDVEVLAVYSADADQLRGIIFGYACHATTLDGYLWCGDYPGYAQLDLEAAHPGAVAMFFAGCGADQNPLPRRRVELAEQYGQMLATAVNETLSGEMKAISGTAQAEYQEIDLPFDKLPSEDQLRSEAESENRYVASRAKSLLAQIAGGTPLSQTYPYPVQTWGMGDDLLLVFLGGEVVVDYALRLKEEIPGERIFVAGYSNDVMAYIPSRRVLNEGGYEGGGAMVYYGLPTVWAPNVEKLIVDEVARQATAIQHADATAN